MWIVPELRSRQYIKSGMNRLNWPRCWACTKCLLTGMAARCGGGRKAKHQREAPVATCVAVVDSTNCRRTSGLRQRLVCVACGRPCREPVGGEWLQFKTQKEFESRPSLKRRLLEERLKKFRERGAKAGTRHLLETMASQDSW